MRILIHGPAFWGKSAYSIQIRHLIDILQDLGVEEIGQSCTFGFQGRVIEMNGITLFPSDGLDIWGNYAILAHARAFKPDYVISMMDVFGFKPEVWSQFKWIAWATVDSRPLWPDIHNALNVSWLPVAYSEYGLEVMRESGLSHSTHIPLCYDPTAYFPAHRGEARERLELPQDRFIVSMVQANRHLDNRKNFGGQIDAFRQFQLKHPDAFLYLHTCRDNSRGGIPLDWLLDELEMVEGRDYCFTDQYTEILAGASDAQMRDIYNASNVLLQATRAEGFGVPMLEAMACGVPIVYTDFGATAEVARGYPVEWEREWTAAGSWWASPYRYSITQALEQSYIDGDSFDARQLFEHVAAYKKEVVQVVHWRSFVDALYSQLETESVE